MIRYVVVTLFLTATYLSFAVEAQAQAVCSGAGIYQSCLSRSGNNSSYSSPYRGTQAGGSNARWYRNAQKTGGVSYNKGVLYGTPVNSGQPVNVSQTSQSAKQAYQSLKADSQSHFICDQNGCRKQ